MSESYPIQYLHLFKEDTRYKPEAYEFVHDALRYAQESLEMGEGDEQQDAHHLTGQELCEGIRLFAIQQYGYMAKLVLNSWGVHTTGDFGNLVYNLIEVGVMKKSDSDRRDHFENVYDFDDAFVRQFQMTTD